MDKIYPYYIGIEFREFYIQLRKIIDKQKDSSLAAMGVQEYWILENPSLEKYNSKRFPEKNFVTEVIWTSEYGLTAYYKKNGDLYKLVKKKIL